jgi:hypothetical protein
MRLVVLLWCMVVPVFFMFPVLRPFGRTHLRSAFQPAGLVTDLDGAIRLANILRHMQWPWSPTKLVSFPLGESIWRWQTITQLVQVLFLWLATRVFEPTFSVNLLVLTGWFLTGVAVYLLARELGAPRIAAATAAAMTQALPAMSTMASNYTSYVFLCVPIGVIIMSLRMGREPCRRNLFGLLASLALTSVFDPYWFLFSLCSVLIIMFWFRERIRNWYRIAPLAERVVATSALTVPALAVLAVWIMERGAANGAMSRQLAVAPVGLVQAGLHEPIDWFNARAEGPGVVIPLLAISMVVLVRGKAPSRALTACMVVASFFILVSTKTSLNVGGVRIGSLAEYVRFVLPGVRFFQRAALISEALLCVLAAMAWWQLWPRVRAVWARATLAVVLAGLLVVDLNPVAHRAVSREADRYSGFRAALAERSEPVVLALLFLLQGRNWLQMGFLDVASANPLYSLGSYAEVDLAASRGPDELAALLSSRNVTHVLSVVGPGQFPIGYSLQPPRYTSKGQLQVNGYEGPNLTIELFEVHAQPEDLFCAACGFGTQLELVSGARLVGDAYSAESSPSGSGSWWWMYGRSADLQLDLVDLPEVSGVVKFQIGNSPCGGTRNVLVTYAGHQQRLTIVGSKTSTVSIPVGEQLQRQPVQIAVEGDSCGIEGDPRLFRLQVYFPSSLG